MPKLPRVMDRTQYQFYKPWKIGAFPKKDSSDMQSLRDGFVKLEYPLTARNPVFSKKPGFFNYIDSCITGRVMINVVPTPTSLSTEI